MLGRRAQRASFRDVGVSAEGVALKTKMVGSPAGGPVIRSFQTNWRKNMRHRREGRFTGLALAGLLMANLFGAHPAEADVPSVKLDTAPLVTPTCAWSYYGTSATHTTGAAATGITPPEIVELARGLGAQTYSPTVYASHVFEYIRNNIAVEFRFGLGKGGYGALVDQSGTPFDQAHLMVALLRQAGITAGYQVGTITGQQHIVVRLHHWHRKQRVGDLRDFAAYGQP